MRPFWLLFLAAPIACGGEPTPAPAAYPPPPGYEPEHRAAADAAPPPPAAVDAGAPSPPPAAATLRADDLVPPWIVETTTPLRPKLDACYTAGLKTAPAMVGTVTLSVGIDRDGKMTASPQANEAIPAAVVNCVVGHLVKARFSPPKGQAPLVLALPLHFQNNPVDGPSVTVGKRDPGY